MIKNGNVTLLPSVQKTPVTSPQKVG